MQGMEERIKAMYAELGLTDGYPHGNLRKKQDEIFGLE